MKTIIRVLVFLSFTFSYAQEHFKFYVEISNSTIVPEVSYRRNGTVNLSFTNRDLNNLFSNYTIFKFEKAFETSVTPRLQNIYYIECNNVNLKTSLENNFSLFFPYVEQVPEIYSLYTPNDYTYSGDILNSKNLDLINVKEAWDYSKGDSDFLVGISDTRIMVNHEDLQGKTYTLYPASSVPDNHGTSSASTAASSTDNNLGVVGVGFNSSILGADIGLSQLLQLSQNGARVVNASWGSCNANGNIDAVSQLVVNEIYNNGTVIVAAAGNGKSTGNGTGLCANPEMFFFPASYNHVISVTSVGSQELGYVYPLNGEERNWRDRINGINGNPDSRHQTNISVDIAAPGYGNWAATVPAAWNNNTGYASFGGTSAAAPHVAGTVSLMFTANTCLNPNEVESLLKLTAVKLDSIFANIPYIGKMGAGRMDAGKATKAAWQMNPTNGGEILLINRTFERWDFELLNSPEYIRLKNEEFIQNANVKFRAKKGITLDNNTLLAPGSGKSHYFFVENTDTCSYFNQTYNPRQIVGKKEKTTLPKSSMKLYPNPSRDYINIQTESNIRRIDIYDLSGKIVKTNYSADKINIENLPKGNYLIKIQLVNSETETIKFTKN